MRIILLLAALVPGLLAQQPAPAPVTPANPSADKSPQSPALPPTQTAAPTAAPATGAPPVMTPAEAYEYAMQPFVNARSAPDDLTEADKWALGIGVSRAKEACESLIRQKLDGEDLLALGKLCIFGQDFEPARATLIHYLDLPNPAHEEVGYLLLGRAFVGLHSVSGAESQADSLLSTFPYDASIHLAIDMVDEAAAASDYADDLEVIGRLNQQQLPHILDTLAHGGAVPASNGDTVDCALLVRDALRIADRLRRTNKQEAADKIVAQLNTDIEAPAILNSASYPAIRNALARYNLYAQPSPVRSFHGAALPVAGPIPARVIPLYDTNPAAHRTVRLSAGHTIVRMSDDRTLILVFSLAGPSCAPAIQHILGDLAKDHVTLGLRVIAVTSWSANIGVDSSTPELLANLRAFRSTLPASLPVYIVPDTELKPFAIDMWPAAILFDGKGRILWLNTLSGSTGSIRQMERDMESPAPPIPQ